jgi:ABC-type polysaccharide/polyol phosphate export permease
MTLPKLIRQSHRWFSLAFTFGFLVNATAIAMAGGEPVPGWIYLLVLVPLFALFGSGLYLFVAPYFARWRSSRMAG